MVRTQISFDAEMFSEARDMAKNEGISFSELCRRAVGQWLRQRSSQERPWMRFAGAIEAGSTEASQTVDEVVYGREQP